MCVGVRVGGGGCSCYGGRCCSDGDCLSGEIHGGVGTAGRDGDTAHGVHLHARLPAAAGITSGLVAAAVVVVCAAAAGGIADRGRAGGCGEGVVGVGMAVDAVAADFVDLARQEEVTDRPYFGLLLIAVKVAGCVTLQVVTGVRVT